MGRFASTVAYYESARPPYGSAFFAAVAQQLALTEVSVCSMSAPVQAFWRSALRLIAVRSSASIRSRAWWRPRARAAERAGVEARFIEGRFEDAAAKLGAFDLVTIGRAIHWLDPEPAQAALERALAPDGKVLVCGATSAKDGRNPWLEAFNAVRDRWKGDRPSRDHETFFANGQFTRTGTIRVEATYTVPVERLVERVLSMSTSSTDRLGDEAPVMKSAMREKLAPFAADGMIEGHC